jgi:copper homeostasis protein
MDRILEICCENPTDALQAQLMGANRIELCENLSVGGVTPSAGKIKQAKALLDIPVAVLIRPRGGDFCYTDEELAVMLDDISIAADLGADAIVSGVLLSDGDIDEERTSQLIEAAGPVPFVFHKAFDVCSDPFKALDQLIEMNVRRVLTSGQAKTAVEGKDMLSALLERANGQIEIMAGGSIRPENLKELLTLKVLTQIHSSAKSANKIIDGNLQMDVRMIRQMRSMIDQAAI